MNNIISKIKKSGLTGRSGSGFPTWIKWESVLKYKSKKKYIVCNASEGEIRVYKDRYLLENHAEDVVDGIKIALKTIKNSEAYIYLKEDYYNKFSKKLTKLIGSSKITLFKKSRTHKYIAGEESSLCEAIEGKLPEPRIKPPYVSEKGIFDMPTLVNNVETFYSVSQIVKNKYNKTRFYSIEGDINNPGVYEFSEDTNIIDILEKTNNKPDFDYFVKVGGGACGRILLEKELKQSICGSGSILVFNLNKCNLIDLAKEWIEFFDRGNCNKCVPCREGVYRLKESLKENKIDKDLFDDLFFVLENTSFCALGNMVPVPFKDLINKLLINEKSKKI